ncbi:hypothetical protein CLV80_10549 [Yoonia maritima]|uniref:AAA ATPase-like protein n=1 Tax=Yoonia maritima TaxID=1435347 RepID=A0A2T0VZ35_9RHOB|nr:hypothetical protein [Yoonia maritima]PRY77566.1 hypothetical protein CLV80_10549 [Yoonia maritima]
MKIRDFNFGDYSGMREYNRNPEFFMNSFITPGLFSLNSLQNGANNILVGRKGTGKSSCCLALAHMKKAEGYLSTFYNFSDDLNRNDLKEAVQTQALDLKDVAGLTKLFDSISSFYDFRDLWKRRVISQIGKRITDSGKKSTFTDFATSVHLAETSITSGVGKGLVIDKPKMTGKLAEMLNSLFPDRATMSLRDFNSIGLDLLKQCHSDVKHYFFFDELNLSHTKSDSSEYETLLALVRDIIRAACELNDFFSMNNIDVHIICSIRPEVRNEIISRDNELSKIIDSNFVSLSWPNHAKVENPLIELMLKKMQFGGDFSEVPTTLIPEKVYNVVEQKDVLFPQYLLNLTWYRPRDVIRVLKCYQITNGNMASLFEKGDDQLKFLKEYSRVSFQDTVAELEVKYSKEIIKELFLRIKKPAFRDKNELLAHLDVLSNRVPSLDELIKDLFDTGVILNYQSGNGGFSILASYRDDAELDPSLRIIIHRGLRSHLNISFNN